MMMNIAILMTCHNRRDKTLACLKELYRQDGDFKYDVYLVDDGSSDNTYEAVRGVYPEVILIRGDGSLYWSGGMRLAWEYALACSTVYDFYIWLNDDVKLVDNAISKLLDSYFVLSSYDINVGAVTGTMVNCKGEAAYGGRIGYSKINQLKLRLLDIDKNNEQQCDVFNGNFVLIPHSSVLKIGILSHHYTHQMGDYDYSFRLNRAGLSCWVARGAYGYCPRNSLSGTYRDHSLDFSKRLSMLNLPNQIAPVDEWCYFLRMHAGILWPLMVAKAKIRKYYPKLWLRLFI